MPKQYEERTCPTCGHTARAWWQPLSRSLVRTLFHFGNAVKTKGRNEIHLQNDVELTKGEYTNFQKLKYFGLVAKHPDKRGYWVLTTNGLAFLQDKLVVPIKVLTFENQLIDRTPEGKKISQFSKDKFGFADHYDFEIIDYKVVPNKITQTNL